MFSLYEFKQQYSVQGKQVVNCLSAYYPKFTKAAESYASRPEESGLALTPDAVELLNYHFNPNKHRKKNPADGLRQIRCRVSPAFADKFNEMARRKGYTAQELISTFVHDWYETQLIVDKLMEGENENKTLVD